MIAFGKDKGLKYRVTVLYNIKIGISRPEIELIFLLVSRSFPIEAQAVTVISV